MRLCSDHAARWQAALQYETTLQREQRLRGASMRAGRLQMAQANREREHAKTMAGLRQQLDAAEAHAGQQLAARAEEFKLLATEVRHRSPNRRPLVLSAYPL